MLRVKRCRGHCFSSLFFITVSLSSVGLRLSACVATCVATFCVFAMCVFLLFKVKSVKCEICNCQSSEIVVFVVVVPLVRKIKKCRNDESETLSRTLFFIIVLHHCFVVECWFAFLRVCCNMCCDMLRFCDVRNYCCLLSKVAIANCQRLSFLLLW